MYALIFALSLQGGDNIPAVEVIDDSGIFNKGLEDKKSATFRKSELSLAEAKQKVIKNEDAFVLYIPGNISNGGTIEIFSQKKAGLSVISTIESQLNDQMRTKLLADAGIDVLTLDKIKPKLYVVSKELTLEGEKDSSSGAAMAVGFAAAILIYMSLFIYGIQVMRGIIEEKTSRIVEVVISSVKPFQLMMGKIVGIGLVGLTQFLLWITLSLGLMTVASQIMFKGKMDQIKSEIPMNKQAAAVSIDGPGMDIIKAIQTVDWTYILPIFIIFFLGGYMLYSALFAAVGSAVENDTETLELIKKLMGSNVNQMKRVFKVVNNKTQKIFDKHMDKAEVKKRRLYWHGSRNENWFNILQTGLLIRPSGAVHTGSMFGDGIYFADKAQKSIGYTSLRGSYWAHGGDNKAFLALFDVHLGKQKEILHHDSSCYKLSQKVMDAEGYNSVFAKGGADLRNNEFIIYRAEQCTISHLIEIGN
jgi:hypothetical protein